MDPRLFTAAFTGDTEALRELLCENPFVLADYTLTNLIENPLNIAAKVGHLQFLKEVIKTAPDLLREQNQDGFRPLDVASAYGSLEIVRGILTADHGICRLSGRDGRTAIHYAAMNGRIEVIDALIDACGDCLQDVTDLGETALHLAVKCSKFPAFARLIEWLDIFGLKKLLNWKDKEGNTILHYAVFKKQLPTVELMFIDTSPIKDMIEVNAVNEKGLTAMDIVDLLMEPSSTDIRLRKMLQQAGGQCAPVLRIAPPEEVGEPPKQEKSKNWRRCFPFHKGRDPPPHVRDALLVICALIATVTFQAGINPPSYIFEVSIQPSHSFTSSTDSMSPPPGESVVGETSVSRRAGMVSLTVFLVANSIALSTSFSIIDYLRRGLPFQRELRVSVFFVMFAYGWSMSYTRPSGLAKDICLAVSLLVPVFISLISDLVNNIVKKMMRFTPHM